MRDNTVLEFCDISKRFPGVQALREVCLCVRAGEIHAIVGENGAGKSTLMKIATGLYQPDRGSMLLDAQPLQARHPSQALKAGIAMVPQELNLVPHMSVAENVLLGTEPRGFLGITDRKALHEKASETLETLGVALNTRQALRELSVANQQMVQIARALAFHCEILIMDEPTARLSEREVKALFDRIRHLQDLGTTIIYISHRMEEVFEIADRITVLRDGELVDTLTRAEATHDDIIYLMVGRSLQEFLQERERATFAEKLVLEAQGLSRPGHFEDVSFELHKGEVLGFAGLVGAGRTDALRSVFGAPPPDTGALKIDGKQVTINSPFDAIRQGIGYAPEERKSQGLFLLMSVLRNITIAFLRRFQGFLAINRREENEEGNLYCRKLNVQTPSVNQQVRYLSGGNQQKVVLSRWLGSGVDILILDEPTRGIDVGAKEEIHSLIGELAAQGKSIVLISSELPELMALADRIVVMREGAVVGEVYPDAVTEEDVLRMAMGGNHSGNASSNPVGLRVASTVDSSSKEDRRL